MTTLKDLRDRNLAEQGKKSQAKPVAKEPEKGAYDRSYSHTEIPSYDHMTGHTTNDPGSSLVSNSIPSAPVVEDSTSSSALVENDLEKRLKAMLATPARTVTFKLHIGIDDWVNQYLADNWRTRPLKMDILAEALTDWIRKKEREKAVTTTGGKDETA
jgi:hypothetical protein